MGLGVKRAGFAEVFEWWWKCDRTSSEQRDAVSSSNGPGTGALPLTEAESALAEKRRKLGRRSATESGDRLKDEAAAIPPRLMADTSPLAYYEAQRWVVQSCADGVRSGGHYPSLVAVMERARRKAVKQLEEEELRLRDEKRHKSFETGNPSTQAGGGGVLPLEDKKARKKKKKKKAVAKMRAASLFKREGANLFGGGAGQLPRAGAAGGGAVKLKAAEVTEAAGAAAEPAAVQQLSLPAI